MREKRRGSRNKTTIIDFRQEVEDPPSKFINVSEEVPSIDEKKKINVPNIGERSFCFSDLMSAFRNIEKRAGTDFECVNDTLKRFKTDEERFQVSYFHQEKMKIESEIFPKISENIFFRNEKNNNNSNKDPRFLYKDGR